MTEGSQGRLELRSSPRVLAPDWQDRLKEPPRVAVFVVFVVALVVGIVRSTGGVQVTLLAAVLVLAGLVGGPIAFKALNTRILITPESVECWDAFRRVTRCERNKLVRLVTVRVEMQGLKSVLSRLLMVDAAGHVRLSLQVDAWSEEQLALIVGTLGLPIADVVQPASPKELNQRYPGAASGLLQHWPVVVMGAVVLVLALVLLGALVPRH